MNERRLRAELKSWYALWHRARTRKDILRAHHEIVQLTLKLPTAPQAPPVPVGRTITTPHVSCFTPDEITSLRASEARRRRRDQRLRGNQYQKGSPMGRNLAHRGTDPVGHVGPRFKGYVNPDWAKNFHLQLRLRRKGVKIAD